MFVHYRESARLLQQRGGGGALPAVTTVALAPCVAPPPCRSRDSLAPEGSLPALCFPGQQLRRRFVSPLAFPLPLTPPLTFNLLLSSPPLSLPSFQTSRAQFPPFKLLLLNLMLFVFLSTFWQVPRRRPSHFEPRLPRLLRLLPRRLQRLPPRPRGLRPPPRGRRRRGGLPRRRGHHPRGAPEGRGGEAGGLDDRGGYLGGGGSGSRVRGGDGRRRGDRVGARYGDTAPGEEGGG